ncbi:hypothetical protein BDR07DRAFT_1457116 [Suillus spraguei]|nr:hypothetical protein BDR07DRAFT_1457116 [Suillus spraguei]
MSYLPPHCQYHSPSVGAHNIWLNLPCFKYFSLDGSAAMLSSSQMGDTPFKLLSNLTDIDFNPYMKEKSPVFFTGDSGVGIRPYESFIASLRPLTTIIGANKKKENIALLLVAMKAIKNETEIEDFRNYHIRDGSAPTRYFTWLEEQLNDDVELNES